MLRCKVEGVLTTTVRMPELGGHQGSHDQAWPCSCVVATPDQAGTVHTIELSCLICFNYFSYHEFFLELP